MDRRRGSGGIVSVSLYNGGLVGAIDDQRRPRITDDGNWSLQGTSEGPGYRALAVYVGGVSDAGLVFGYRPSAQREPFEQAVQRKGVFTREGLLAWRGPQLRPGDVCEMILTGGSRYVGWGDTAGQDWMEWGSRDPRDASRTVVATTGPLKVGGSAPPPPPPPPPGDRRLQLDKRLPAIRDEALKEMRLAQASWDAWYRSNPDERRKALAYLAALADGKSPAPPKLATHRGRAVVALLRAAAGSVGRLP